MKRTFALSAAAAAISIALASLALPVAAQEGTLKKIKDSGSITVGHRDASIPFSYYDDKQQPVGYAVDLCMRIVDAVKTELKMPKLDVKYQLVTSANRIPLMANGTIDLECGSTTNNLERQKTVWFTITVSRMITRTSATGRTTAAMRRAVKLRARTKIQTSGWSRYSTITSSGGNGDQPT